MEKSPCLMGKSTISMAIFNSHVSLPEGQIHVPHHQPENNISDSWTELAVTSPNLNLFLPGSTNWIGIEKTTRNIYANLSNL